MKGWLSALYVVLALLVSACGDDDPADAEPAIEGAITVSAAASLRGAFAELAEAFTEANPETDVELNFDSSARLSTQIIEGAPVDIFASADEANMIKLTDADLVAGSSETFARNQMVIVTKPGNPAGITSPADLASAGVISLCAVDVPCGRYAAEVLDNAGVTIDESNVTRGQNATATLTAVTEGDAVAAMVYSTDAASAGDAVDMVEIPKDVNVIVIYPIGVLTSAGNPEVAQAFLDFVLSAQAQTVLANYEFVPRS